MESNTSFCFSEKNPKIHQRYNAIYRNPFELDIRKIQNVVNIHVTYWLYIIFFLECYELALSLHKSQYGIEVCVDTTSSFRSSVKHSLLLYSFFLFFQTQHCVCVWLHNFHSINIASNNSWITKSIFNQKK